MRRKKINDRLGLTHKMFMALVVVAIVGLAAMFVGVAISGRVLGFGEIHTQDESPGELEITCMDSDGGEIYDVVGTTGTTAVVATSTDICKSDVGVSSYSTYGAHSVTGDLAFGGDSGDDLGDVGGDPGEEMLMEYYCDGNAVANIEFDCETVQLDAVLGGPAGWSGKAGDKCIDGKCVEGDDAPQEGTGVDVEAGGTLSDGDNDLGVDIVVTDGATNVIVEATTVTGLSVAAPVADDVLPTYIDITVTNLDNAIIGAATIYFSVDDTWLMPDINPAEVILQRFVDGAWVQLPTEQVTPLNPVAGKTYFMATTPGFSSFAITAIDQGLSADADGDGNVDDSTGSSPSGGPTGGTKKKTTAPITTKKVATQTYDDYEDYTEAYTKTTTTEEGMDWWIWALIAGGGGVVLIVIVVVIIFAMKKKPGAPVAPAAPALAPVAK